MSDQPPFPPSEPTPGAPVPPAPPVPPVPPVGSVPPAAPYAPPAAPYVAPPVGAKQTMSLVGFIFGIASFVLGWIPFFGILLSIAGLIINIIGHRREPNAPKWMWIVGLIGSIIGIIEGLIYTIVVIIVIAVGVSSGLSDYSSY